MKKQSQHIVLILLLIAFLGTSCEEEYKIDTSDFEASLVVNGLFTPNVPWSVSVTNSKQIFDETEIGPVEDAVVEIYGKDGRHLYNLFYDENGKFSNDDIAPSYGQCYTVKVSADGYPSAVAQDQVPEKGTLTVNKTFISDENGNVIDTEISFFIGKPDEETYLVWELYNEEEIGEDGIAESSRNLTNSWLNQLYNNPRSVLQKGGVKVGKTITGNVTTTLEKLLILEDGGRSEGPTSGGNPADDKVGIYTSGDLNIGSIGGGEDGEGGEDGDSDGDGAPTYELRVMTISKELHDYYNSIEEHYKYNSISVEVPATPIYTNVKNGYGIFAAYHEQVITF